MNRIPPDTMTSVSEPSRHLFLLLFSLLLTDSSPRVRKFADFDVEYSLLLDRSWCYVEGNATCSHLSCAMYCLHESEWCTSFALEDNGDNDSCTCCLCEHIDRMMLQPGDGVVGFMKPQYVDCSDPPPIPGAEVTYTSTSLNACATYTCDLYHTYISGDWTSYCGASGYWSPVTIHCVPTGCYFWDSLQTKYTYNGQVNVTQNGAVCQRWGDLSPHVPDTYIINELMAMNAGDVNTNYCRSLGVSQEPWCYTTDPGVAFDLCDIPQCPGR